MVGGGVELLSLRKEGAYLRWEALYRGFTVYEDLNV